MLNTDLDHKLTLILRRYSFLCIFVLLLFVVNGNLRADISEQRYDFNITQSTLGEALETFARQA